MARRRTTRAERLSTRSRRLPLNPAGGGAEITPANARFFASPLPVVLHILSASVYAILGAFQFAPGFRRRMPGWHRVGRLARGYMWTTGWAVRSVDDSVLSPAQLATVSCFMHSGSCLGLPWSCPSSLALPQSDEGT